MFAKNKKAMPVTFIFVLLLTSCAASSSTPSDSDIAAQVTNLMKNDKTFSEFIEVVNVTVKDKLIKDKEMKAICNVAVRIKKEFVSDSGIAILYGRIIGQGAGAVGQTRSHDVRFRFEKYESGWRIQGVTE
jgi:hypothetical protein